MMQTPLRELNEHRPSNDCEMSRTPVICRICLSMNVRMFSIAETPLQTVYEKIIDAPLHSADMRPVTVCYICSAQLKKCQKLMTMATKSQNVLTEILNTYHEVSTRSAALINHQANNLSLKTIPVEYFDTTSFNTSACDDIGQECVKLKKEPEYVEIEYEGSVDPGTSEYDINKVKCESDMDADMLWQHIDETPQLETDVKIEFQEEVQEGESPVHATENKPVESEQQEPHRDSTLPRIHQCEFCHRVYAYKKSYRSHLKSHKVHECNVCKQRFSTKNALTRHMSTRRHIQMIDRMKCETVFFV